MKKNILFMSVSVILLILLGIGVSYSMWNMSSIQDTENVISTSDCFDISITSQENSINLKNTYPISDEKGKSLTPFTFTITNTCETAVKYSINLESLSDTTLSSSFLDIMLNNGEIKRLSSYSSVNKVNSTSIENRELETGILGNKESRDYSLRLWIDYDTTMEDLNNESKVLKSKVIVVGTPINYTGHTVFNFDYTGGEQTFIVPVSGTYKLETWGAQGGSIHGRTAGTGGYSSGFIKSNSKQVMFVNVGGQGDNGEDYIKNENTITKPGNGGYNGGGTGQSGGYYSAGQYTCASGSGGGGATHIALNSGLLSSLENYKNQILIVSGGGGGISGFTTSDNRFGHAGGYSAFSNLENKINQLSGYAFGIGETITTVASTEGCGGGGGGYYGGKCDDIRFGTGGSSYIGNSLLTNKVMYCYNCEESNEINTKTISTTCNEETPTSYCAKKGNGYARITLVSIEE